jgi:hypothetical protein
VTSGGGAGDRKKRNNRYAMAARTDPKAIDNDVKGK